MKKLMLTAAIVCAAVMSQASTVTWGLTSGALDTVKFADATAYLIQTASLAKPTLTEANAATWYADNKASLASKAFRSQDVSAGVVSDTELIDEKIGMKQYWMIVVADDEKNIAVSAATKSGNIQTGTTNLGLTWTTDQVSTFAVAVPEPTSAMFLLLGVAGLALKRRRA